MAVIRGLEGSVQVFYGVNAQERLEKGISEWKLTLQSDVQSLLLCRMRDDELTPYGELPVLDPATAIPCLKTPFIAASQAALEFTLYYDDDSDAFGNSRVTLPRGRWYAALFLRDPLTFGNAAQRTPYVDARGYLAGMEIRNHVRGVPVFRITLAVDYLNLMLATEPDAGRALRLQ